jgi:hypothetical protein
VKLANDTKSTSIIKRQVELERVGVGAAEFSAVIGEHGADGDLCTGIGRFCEIWLQWFEASQITPVSLYKLSLETVFRIERLLDEISEIRASGANGDDDLIGYATYSSSRN